MLAAYKQHPEYSWKELEELGNSKDGIDKLKEISKTNFKNYEKIASEL